MVHCNEGVLVRLPNATVVPGVAFEIISFNQIQADHEHHLNKDGASMLGGGIRFKMYAESNFIQETRVAHGADRRRLPAMVAAMMRPGVTSSMHATDYFHCASVMPTSKLWRRLRNRWA